MGTEIGKQKDCNSNITSNDGGHRRNDIVRCIRERAAIPELYLSHVSHAQERRQHATYFQSAKSQQLSHNFKIPSDKYAKNPRLSTAFRLASKNRSLERVFSHSGIDEAQKVLATNLRQPTATNDVPPVWSSYGTKNILNDHQLDRADPERERNTNCDVFRRLFDCKSRQRIIVATSTRNNYDPKKSGLANKFCKIDPDPTKMPRISWNMLGPMDQPKISTSNEMSISREQNCDDPKTKNGKPKGNPELGGPHKFCQFRCATGTPKPSQPLEVSKATAAVRFLSPLRSPKTSYSRAGMVVKKPHQFIPLAYTAGQALPYNRRVRDCMGSSPRQYRTGRSLVSPRETSEFQREGNACCIPRRQRAVSAPGELYSHASKRQQDGCGVHQKRRRLKIDQAHACYEKTIRLTRQVIHSSGPSLLARENKLRSRSLITLPSSPRVALTTRSDGCSIQEMGDAYNRSNGIQCSSRSSPVRQFGLDRPECLLSRRIQSAMGLSSCVDLSTPIFNTEGIVPPQHRKRSISDCSSRVGQSVLDAGSQESCHLSPVHHPAPSPSTSGHVDRPTPATSSGDVPASVEMWGWTASLTDWTPEQIGLLRSGWRDSSIKTYHHAWLKWLGWCKENNVTTPDNPSGSNLARFLIDLYQKSKLSYRTILVYKSAVSTLCNPDSAERLSSNILVKKVLKSIANQNPKEVCKPPIWDTDDLVTWLLNNIPDQNNFYQCSRRAAVLLLLCSGRRVHDLTLLAMDSNHCFISDDHIILWPKFGAKTDNSENRQSGWRLSSNDNQRAIDPVFWTKRVIELSSERRSVCKVNNLFLTACGPPKAASRAVLAGWVRRTLAEAGIRASAGSTRPAVASKHWALNMPIDEILMRGNWRSQDTFRNHYCRVIRPRTQTNLVSAMFSPIAN